MFKMFLFVFFGLFIFTNSLLLANPWGKDADLALPPPAACQPSSPSLLAYFGEKAIRFHQDVISPADGPRSHFIPSSSQYTLEAMRKYGFFQGYVMGCDRLMRENSEEWVYRKILDERGRLTKWDPVP
ncbi:membrane protein insertion efficiency factor YidD [Candidatus Protochlamydia phocaeensis]|uniref:membrane protein insertion efficiency factor YidD n=1 Tax=Candidatus Protochlamydia phocaeensis TaxID=1414722 RepID=UPI0008383728|nr:membrane protein insertion efficiency factor YidD [Candidatus Protochlamydia phocaeensis]